MLRLQKGAAAAHKLPKDSQRLQLGEAAVPAPLRRESACRGAGQGGKAALSCRTAVCPDGRGMTLTAEADKTTSYRTKTWRQARRPRKSAVPGSQSPARAPHTRSHAHTTNTIITTPALTPQWVVGGKEEAQLGHAALGAKGGRQPARQRVVLNIPAGSGVQ